MKGILLDIEGTTTPIRFVTDVLFAFAREHLEDHVARHLGSAALEGDLRMLREERDADERQGLAPPPWDEGSQSALVHSVVAHARWLMDQDRKSTPLKSIQGRIWQEGYRSGALRGEVFEDVPPSLELWTRSGIEIRIFSSGSVLAQKLLFASTASGDLTRFLSGFHDTTTGPKASPASYERIAGAWGIPTSSIMFVSDVVAELDAAREAGMETLLCVRPGNLPQPDHGHLVVTSLASIAFFKRR